LDWLPKHHHTTVLWGLFTVLVVACLAIDLRMGRDRHGRMPVRTAAFWSFVWIALGMSFAAALYFYPPDGPGPGSLISVLFVTGYLLEKALSVDNMFVFIMIFKYFAVQEEDQPRVLKWGILGALFFRAVLIAGAAILAKFKFVLYAFALILVWAAYKMLTSGEDDIHPEDNRFLKLTKRFFPIVNRYQKHDFFTIENGRRVGTALLVVLIVIESTDIVFALDSIPAIFAVTLPELRTGAIDESQQFFLVFTSNVFAILGLRALFFVLAGIMEMFRFLKPGVAAILFFIAVKMLTHDFFHITPGQSLAVIGVILTISIVLSMTIKPKEEPAEAKADAPPPEADARSPLPQDQGAPRS
jgi:tellurite resistance protein TerC